MKKLKINSFKCTFVLRHRWEEGSKSILKNYEAHKIRTNWQLGIWARIDKVVGSVKQGSNKTETVKKTFTGENLVNDYYIGLNLIVCKVWVNFSFKPTFGF